MMDIIVKKEADLIKKIKVEHNAYCKNAEEAVRNAINCGQYLAELKEEVEKDSGSGCKSRFRVIAIEQTGLSNNQITWYQRLFNHDTEVSRYLEGDKDPSVKGALRYIAPEPVIEPEPSGEETTGLADIDDICSKLSKSVVGFTTQANDFHKKVTDVIKFQSEASEASLWELKKNISGAAKILTKLAEQIDVTDKSFKEKIKENENVIDVWPESA